MIDNEWVEKLLDKLPPGIMTIVEKYMKKVPNIQSLAG